MFIIFDWLKKKLRATNKAPLKFALNDFAFHFNDFRQTGTTIYRIVRGDNCVQILQKSRNDRETTPLCRLGSGIMWRRVPSLFANSTNRVCWEALGQSAHDCEISETAVFVALLYRSTSDLVVETFSCVGHIWFECFFCPRARVAKKTTRNPRCSARRQPTAKWSTVSPSRTSSRSRSTRTRTRWRCWKCASRRRRRKSAKSSPRRRTKWRIRTRRRPRSRKRKKAVLSRRSRKRRPPKPRRTKKIKVSRTIAVALERARSSRLALASPANSGLVRAP